MEKIATETTNYESGLHNNGRNNGNTTEVVQICLKNGASTSETNTDLDISRKKEKRTT